MSVLSVKKLTKQFGSFVAVNNISFELRQGEILGLLGPNGAGKTTTIQMLLGIMTPTEGEIQYFEKPFPLFREEILEKVNFSSTYTNLPWDLTVKECLCFSSYLYDIKNRKERIKKIVEIFRLSNLLKQTLNQLSAGQVTRLNLAKAFLNFPAVLLLDEPTASLDPDVADMVRKFLLEEREQFGVSMIFTSHNMAEVEEVCDRVIFISHGKIIADNTPLELARSIELCHIELFVPQDLLKLKEYLKKHKFFFKEKNRYIRVDMKEKMIANFFSALAKEKILYEEVSIEKPTLEDYFLEVTRKKTV